MPEASTPRPCPFCLPEGRRPNELIQLGPLCAAMVDVCPKNIGHLVIFPLRHVASLFALTEEEWASIKGAAEGYISSKIHEIDLQAIYRRILCDFPPGDTKVIQRCQAAMAYLQQSDRLNPTGFTFGINEGEHSGKEFDHVHFHLIPAYADHENRRGIRNM